MIHKIFKGACQIKPIYYVLPSAGSEGEVHDTKKLKE